MRPQTELPLYECEPAPTTAGVGRCYMFVEEARDLRRVVRRCPRGECLCPICAAADAVVARFERNHP